MLLKRKLTIFSFLMLSAATLLAQLNQKHPRIGYLYPAGAQQGTTAKITIGGQFLRGANNIYITGEGIETKVIQYMRPVGNLNKDDRQAIMQNIKRASEISMKDLPPKMRQTMAITKATPKSSEKTKPKKNKETDKDKQAETTELPEMKPHPLLHDLQGKSFRELIHIRDQLFMPRNKLQPNRQLAENVIIEVTISPDAKPGYRELRLATAAGLTNPVIFHVGTLPEKIELEPNDTQADPKLPKFPDLPKQKAIALPATLNGQIRPGDVDRFRFRATQGQQLVIETQARSLIPYLADAVPGWFQATVALFDGNGKEVAFADDFRFNPDPVLFYKIDKTGYYELEIRDAIYRGREDFVYRVAISQQPFITHMFPLGGRTGKKSTVTVSGWNLPDTQLQLDTTAAANPIRKTLYQKDDKVSNTVSYAIDTLSEFEEFGDNNAITQAHNIILPMLVNGRIETPGDVDVFKFRGLKDTNIVAEVYARRLNSPVDSIVRITNAEGNILAYNDDYVLKDTHLHKDILGLTTHHADSYLTAKLPKSGFYYLHIADSQNHGSQAHAYRLRLSKAQPDFALRITPSSINVPAGGIVPIRVHALRKDGFDGEIDISIKDAPEGFKLQGAKIPAGNDSIRMTMRVPYKNEKSLLELQFQGKATVNGKTITHTALPAEDMMQAFLYRHLVLSEKMMVMIKKRGGKVPPSRIVSEGPIEIPAGGSAKVTMAVPAKNVRLLNGVSLQLYEPPEGLTLHDVKKVKEGISFVLKADANAKLEGLRDNLIIEALKEYTPKDKQGNPLKQKRTHSMGAIPAVPIHIVKQPTTKT